MSTILRCPQPSTQLNSVVPPCVSHTPPASQQVANYCVIKLAELNVHLATHAVGWTPEGQVPPTAAEQQVLELTCNGVVSVSGKRRRACMVLGCTAVMRPKQAGLQTP